MLDSFATNPVKKQPDEKVIFAIISIFQRLDHQLELQVKYEKVKKRNISVTIFAKISDLDAASLTNTTFCIGEICIQRIGNDDVNRLLLSFTIELL